MSQSQEGQGKQQEMFVILGVYLPACLSACLSVLGNVTKLCRIV